MTLILTIQDHELKRFDLPELVTAVKMTGQEQHEAKAKFIDLWVNYYKKAYSQLFDKPGVKVWISFESKMNPLKTNYDKLNGKGKEDCRIKITGPHIAGNSQRPDHQQRLR